MNDNNIPPQNSTIINVCIVPPPEIGQRIVDISQSLKSEKTMFVLDGKNKFPHMTLYMARFHDDQLENVILSAEEIIKNIKSFHCKHSGYFKTAGRYFEISYEKTNDLVSLHDNIIKNIKHHRLDPENPYKENYYAPYTSEQHKNAKETGYDLA